MILNKITGEIYPSAKYAAKEFNFNHGSLMNKLRGDRKNNTNLVYYE